jgi:site-specific DNA-methyltransferase (adenine-specific)
MPPSHQILVGDCIEMMRTLPDNSVDSVVTDPPYGLSFMGKKWDYDVPATEAWVECLRVLKPGGHLLAFAGTRTQHRMAVRIEDAGFEIRDMIAWVYGSGFPKSHNLGGSHESWGTALKPALEPITVARKPFSSTVAANVIAHGTGALNIDRCRVTTGDDTARVSNGAIKGGNFAAGGSAPGPIAGGHSDGRWPANLIHDGSAEVVALLPAQAGVAAPVTGNEPTANGQRLQRTGQVQRDA